MGSARNWSGGKDLAQGVALGDISPGRFLVGHVNGEPVLLTNLDGRYYAVSAVCTHYGAPLSEGLVVGETVRCPWHHACFSLKTGAALKAPAFDGLQQWRVDIVGDRAWVRTKLPTAIPASPSNRLDSRKFVIIGGGAAGFAAADMLRKQGFNGELTMLSDDSSPPCDRPNLSKDFLAGTASADWIPLKPPEYYVEHRIDLRLNTHVERIDVERKQVITADGSPYPFDALLIATGAEPSRLDTPGFDRPNVHTLRSVGDAERIIANSATGASAAVIGASFIGLEVAASLIQRGMKVHVVAPEEIPMARVLGSGIGRFIQSLHEEHAVQFHLGHTAKEFDGKRLTLDDDTTLNAELVVVGVGVKPRTTIGVQSGLAVDNGILVDEYLETNVAGVFAAGDVANAMGPNGDRVRVEHWVVAERQGQTAAMNMLGHRRPFLEVPFFWSRHFNTSVLYVGHAADWDECSVSGSVSAGDCRVQFCLGGAVLAVATIGRPMESMIDEARLESRLLQSERREQHGVYASIRGH